MFLLKWSLTMTVGAMANDNDDDDYYYYHMINLQLYCCKHTITIWYIIRIWYNDELY